MMKLKLFAAIAGCAVLSGCYSNKPLEVMPPAPRTHISAELSDTGTVVMGVALGSGVVGIEGVVESATADQWELHMLRTDLKDGRSILWNNELVTFPSRVVIDPRVRILDKRKSWLTAGGVVAGALIAARAFNLIGADDNKSNTPEPGASLIPGGGK